MEKMLVTQGLNELKLLSDRIKKAIENSSFVIATKNSSKNATPSQTKEEFCGKAKSDFQSIMDLIERRKKIKAAIVKSNSVTEVTISGQTMTVAEAIERKASISYEVELFEHILRDFSEANNTVLFKNTSVDSAIDRLIEAAYGKDSKQNIRTEDYNAIANPYKEANEYGLVDPLGVKKLTDSMSTDIDGFLSSVDSALQISNCTTFIEF